MIAQFTGGPVDGMLYRLSDKVPGTPPRVVVIGPPPTTAGGPLALVYGPALETLPAPVAGGPVQHVYEVGDLTAPAPAVVIAAAMGMEVPDPVRTYSYRGLHPADDAPTQLAGPHFVGPVRLPCHGGRTDMDHGCLIPPGIDALELLDDEPHELDTIARAHGCPNHACGRLFLMAPTS